MIIPLLGRLRYTHLLRIKRPPSNTKSPPKAMASSQAPAAPKAAAPWQAAFPAPRDVELGALDREEVLRMIKDVETREGVRDFVLVDVRRNDHEVCVPP